MCYSRGNAQKSYRKNKLYNGREGSRRKKMNFLHERKGNVNDTNHRFCTYSHTDTDTFTHNTIGKCCMRKLVKIV